MFVNLCPCGGRIHENSHVVYTLRGLQMWNAEDARADMLPCRIVQRECEACGRYECRTFPRGRMAEVE